MAAMSRTTVISKYLLCDRNWPLGEVANGCFVVRQFSESSFVLLAGLEKHDRQEGVVRRPSALQIHCRKAVIEFRLLKAVVRH
jgi:hypothetical protein